MRFLEKLEVIERIDALIKRKGTGTAKDLASRLQVSRSTVYEILDVMKLMGAEIEYCSNRGSYYYTIEKTLSIVFVDAKKIKGGRNNIALFQNTFLNKSYDQHNISN